jgi:hypothetical protein
MNHRHLICEVCYASIPLEPDHLYAAHLRWHRTLTNLPGATLTSGQSLAGEGGPDATP